MAGRPRNLNAEIRALELRARGQSQTDVAATLGCSVRTVARYEQRWRRGDRPLPELLAVTWLAYDQEQHAWRRVQLLQALSKSAIAAAEEERTKLLCAAVEQRRQGVAQVPAQHNSRSRQVSRQDVPGALDLLDNAINKCGRRTT